MIMRRYQQEDTDTETKTDLSPQAPNKVIILLRGENEACTESVFQKKSQGKDGQSSFLDSPTMRNVLSGLCFYDHATDAQEPYCLARTHHRTGGEGGREADRQRQKERKKERKKERESETALPVCVFVSFCPSRNYSDYFHYISGSVPVPNHKPWSPAASFWQTTQADPLIFTQCSMICRSKWSLLWWSIVFYLSSRSKSITSDPCGRQDVSKISSLWTELHKTFMLN